MSPSRLVIAVTTATLLLASPAAPADDGIFRIDTTVDGVRTTTSYASVEDAIDALKGSNLGRINPAYTGTQAAQVSVDYRGVALSATYAGAGASALVLSIPSIGLVRTLDGGSRDQTQQLLKNYFKQDSDDVLGRLSKTLVAHSPVDPIAGNPTSLMSRIVAQDFGNGVFPMAAGVRGGDAANLFAVGLDAGGSRQAGIDGHVYSMPLSYTIRNADDPRQQLVLRAPLAVVDVEGSKAYDAGLGIALRQPIGDRWTLTPAFDYAAAGSRDLGSLAGMASLSLTSRYELQLGGYDVAIGDMLGYYKGLRVKSGNYGYDPNVQNTVLRNGVAVATPVVFAGHAMSVEYSIIDTHFFGDELYVQHTDEVGVSVGSDRRAATAGSLVRAGVSFLFSPKAKGFSVGVKVAF